MNKKKLSVQCIACLCIFTAAKIGIFSMDYTHYTADDILNYGMEVLNMLESVPENVKKTVKKVNSNSIYDEPLSVSENGLKKVYATRGGNVVKSGLSEKYGLYVIIGQDDEERIYGNLHSIKVVTGDRINKGDIIGSYSDNNQREFYYEIRNSNSA